MPIPTKKECLILLMKNKTPSDIIKHSKAVCRVAEEIADRLIKKGMELDKKLVIAAALLHDIERAKKEHAPEGAKLLKRLGFQEVSEAVKRHSLHKLEARRQQPRTIEEKIVFYADKKAMGNKIVSLKERFKALEKAYNLDLSKEFAFTKRLERELLGNKRV